MGNKSGRINRVLLFVKSLCYTIELYGMYFIIVWRLRRHGLKKIVSQCTTRRKSGRPLSEDQETKMVALTKKLTCRVLKWHVLPNSCVWDALLPCWFLARRGIKADFVIVVRHHPFMAHAMAQWRDVLLTAPPPSWFSPQSFVVLMQA